MLGEEPACAQRLFRGWEVGSQVERGFETRARRLGAAGAH